MQQSTFVQRRATSWERLEALLGRAGRRGVRRLQPEEVEELGRLYRWTTSDLAYAQGRSYDAPLLEYLNRLTARSHAHVYGGSAQTGWDRIGSFYTTTFPNEFRRSFVYFAICTGLMALSAIVAYVVVRNHPHDAYALLPADLIPPEIKKSLHDSNFAVGALDAPTMAASIIQNNVKIALLEFGGCVTLGLSTIYVTVFNGIMLGGVAALFTNKGFGPDFWITVSPHGFIELSAFNIAGASGLLVTAGIIYPGRLRRRDAIRINAQRAAVLIAGAASMLLIAGTIEGFISPRRLPAGERLAVGLCTLAALIIYFGFAGAGKALSSRAQRTK
jgi:uncharacterized membrane protein SpoIIM required for sporulation